MNPALEGISAIAFDLDGTLIDSAPDIQHALNAALNKAGLERIDELETVRGWIGDGPDALIARALARLGAQVDDAELRARLRRWFDVATLAAPLSLGGVFPGVPALVETLHRRMPMVVVTNKPTPLARAVLDAAGLLPFLGAVHGGDEPGLRKPAPGLLLQAAQQLGIAPARLLMVGDSVLDLRAARSAGCPAVLALWGYGGRALPDALEPRRIDAPGMLLQALGVTPAHDERITHD